MDIPSYMSGLHKNEEVTCFIKHCHIPIAILQVLLWDVQNVRQLQLPDIILCIASYVKLISTMHSKHISSYINKPAQQFLP